MPSWMRVPLLGLCPQCGRGQLFKKLIVLRKSCPSCGCDFAPYAPEDGSAAFVIFFGGVIFSLITFLLEVFYQPPYWAYAVFGAPVLLLMAVILIRPVKAWLVFQKFHHSNDNQ